MTGHGLITIQSDYTVKETIDKLAAIIESKGLTVFARVDHAGNAARYGLQLRPIELIIFGNPNAGTVLIQDKQTVGIDLPVKTLAWEDEDGTSFLTYNDAGWMAERHNLTERSAATLDAIKDGMKLLVSTVAKK